MVSFQQKGGFLKCGSPKSSGFLSHRTGGNPHDLFLETSIINHYEVSLKIINIIYTTVIKKW